MIKSFKFAKSNVINPTTVLSGFTLASFVGIVVFFGYI